MHAPSPPPVVALVGRPNTGKSTLFNRLAGERRAVVQRTPGVTRDRLYAPVEWNGLPFTLVDTGGIAGEVEDAFSPLVAAQADVALAEAAAAVLVVDAQAGVLPGDAELAERLRRWGRPVLVCANKAESARAAWYEFHELGLGEPLPVSALHGEGTGDLLDAIQARLAGRRGGRSTASGHAVVPPQAGLAGEAGDAAGEARSAAGASSDTAVERPAVEGPLRVAVVGRPNVGKSSLVNRLVGRERLITSEVAGTTRDAVDVPWGPFLLVDTPGLRRPARIEQELEHLSVRRALRAAERAEVVVLVLDATEAVTDQDKRIAGFAHDRGRAAVLVLNKVDLLADLDPDAIRRALPLWQYAEVLPLSARTGWHVGRLAAALERAGGAHRRRLSTAECNRVVRAAVAEHAPPSSQGKPLRIYYATQAAAAPPTFVCFVNDPARVRADYARYLENRLRAAFDFRGTPLRFRFRARRTLAQTVTARPRRGRAERRPLRA